MTRNHYIVNECFFSVQGEGHRVGTVNVFLRFAFCSLQCVDASKLGRPLQGNEVDTGWFCDTDFAHGEKLTLAEVVALVKSTDEGACKSVIFTGGEPSLQVDAALCLALKDEGYFLAIETNGTRSLPRDPAVRVPVDSRLTLLDWVSCSPKPGTKVVLERADEVRCVVKPGQYPWIPETLEATHRFVSPACFAPAADAIAGFKGKPGDLSGAAVDWALAWCKGNPRWRFSTQSHKWWGVR